MKAVFVSIAVIVIFLGFLSFNRKQTQTNTVQNIPTPSSTFIDEKVNIKASFKIITGNIERSFKAEKYHNLSSDVYIQASDPTIVHVNKKGISWGDFFKTLPMKLTKDCLTTGTGQQFCTGGGGTLKFFLNDVEDNGLLDKEIQDGGKALIKFIPF